MDVSKYKSTSIGLIPIDWDVNKFDKVTKLITCGLASTPTYVEAKIGMPFFSAQNVQDGKVINGNYKYIPIQLYNQITKHSKPCKGDILYTRVGAGIGEAGIIDFDLDFGIYVSLTLIKSDIEKLHNYFLLHLLNSDYYRYLAKRDQFAGGGVQNLNVQVVKEFRIPLPPIQEQQKIATILSTWDVAIDNCKNIIKKISDRNKGLEQQFLSGKIRVKGFEKSQWHLKSVEEVAVFKNGKAHENCIDEEGDYFVVNSKFISTQGKVAKASNENLCPLFKNDITMVMSDIPNGKAFAKCFYIPEDDKYTLNQRICALTARKGTDSKFLYYQMNRNNYYLAFNNGVSQTNLKKDEVLECPLLMPDIEEQIQIVKLIDTANEELNQYQQKLETLQLQKKGLIQQLLTGKTRVKI